jgi:methionyl-tRNA formyltransferase
LRLAFAGTPEFARAALQAIHDAGHQVPLVLTQPDRPAGRGMKLQASAVKQLALDLGLPVAQPRSLRLDGRHPDDAKAAHDLLRQVQPEVMVVAAYGLILPPWALQLPPRGCINIHASLLPRWRGAAPIHRALEAGDASTGITIMQMDEGLDTGAMLLTRSLPIDAGDTTATLHDRLAAMGAGLVVQALAKLEQGTLQPRMQPAEGVSYARKIEKSEAGLDWAASASQLERRVRAFDPAPGCHTELEGLAFKVWRAQPVPGHGQPGQRLAAGPGQLVVACGEGALALLEVQLPGGRRMSGRDLLQRLAPMPG